MSGTLKEVRVKLRKRFKMVEPGFYYEAVFGCDEKERHSAPLIRVRVELRAFKLDSYRFYIFIDCQLPIKMDIETAEFYLKAMRAATRKARWAEKVIDGLDWDTREVT